MLRSFFVLFAAAFVAACSSDVETESGATTSGSGASTSASSVAASSSAAAGGGSTCGGLAGVTCPSGEYCAYMNQDCGADDGEGMCTPEPMGCTDEYAPVCGCDGEVYGNACAASSMGVDVSMNGDCAPPDGYFACGPDFCALAESYCEYAEPGFSGFGMYACMSLPAKCVTAPTCECLVGMAGDCKGDGATGLTVDVPGG